MNCEQCQEKLFEYVEGLLGEEQRRSVREHLDSCEQCSQEASETASLHTRLVSNGKVYSASGLEDKVFDRIVREQTYELRRLEKTNVKLEFWSKIMHSKITKFAVAAVVVAAVMLSLTVMEKSTPVAMADIMEAMHSVRYLHMKIMHAGAEVHDEAWIEFDEIGNVQNIRMQIHSQAEGAAEGLKVAVWKEGKAKIWVKEKNVLMEIPEQEAADQILNAVTKLDPKHAIENVYEGEETGELVLNIKEPSNKIDPIIIDVEVPAEDRLLVLSIDQATKLLKSFKIYLLENGEYAYKRTIEYHDYNQPIDPAMFVLEDEIPEDAIVINQTSGAVGLEQEDLSDEEIAVKVAREFFEAMIAKDYAKAGALLSGIPAEQMEQLYGHLNIVEIVSIGEASVSPASKSLKVPCVLMIEEDGQVVKWSPDGPFVRQVQNQAGRWEIIGGI